MAVAEIHVNVSDSSASRVFINGTLSDGSTYEFEQTEAVANKYVGKMTSSGTWMVKAANVSVKCGPLAGRSDVYLLSRGEGFNFKNKYVAEPDMDAEMRA